MYLHTTPQQRFEKLSTTASASMLSHYLSVLNRSGVVCASSERLWYYASKQVPPSLPLTYLSISAFAVAFKYVSEVSTSAR